MTRSRRTVLSIVSALAGAALLAWYVQRIGVHQIADGFASLGAGIVVILGLSLARFVLRSEAWRTLLPNQMPFSSALAAVIAGDALGNLIPIGLMASEPAKALYVSDAVPASRALAALMAETFFYSISIGIYILLGAAAMLEAFDLPAAMSLAGAISVMTMAIGLGIAAGFASRKPAILSMFMSRLPGNRLGPAAERLREFEAMTYGAAGREGVRLGRIAVLETSFQLLSFAEAWYTVYLLTGESRPLAAFVLDAFGRVSNIIFRVVPLRLGVDQAGSGLVAQSIGLDAATGATLSLVRTARVLVFAGIGLGILARRAGRKN
jgi:hypothetical protein